MVEKSNITIHVIDHVIEPITKSLADVLGSNPRLSTMKKIVSQSSLTSFLEKNHDVSHICFTGRKCVPVTGGLKEHFKDLNTFKQYTIQALDNSVFKAMPRRRLKNLLTRPYKSDSFLKKHIFMGILNHNTNKRVVATPIANRHPVSEIIPRNGLKAITHNSKTPYVIDDVVRVKEGIVQILKPYQKE